MVAIVFFLCILGAVTLLLGLVSVIAYTCGSSHKRVRITHYASDGTVLGAWVAEGNYFRTDSTLNFEVADTNEQLIICGTYRVEPVTETL